MKFLVFMILALSGCGTDVGNPGLLPTYGSQPASGILTDFMSQSMCNKLNSCFPSLSYADCYNGVHAANGLTTAMGLNASTYPTLSAAEQGVRYGLLTLNSANLSQCQSSINALTCADANVTSAYSTSSATNFNNTYHMLSTDSICAHTTQ